MGACCTVQYADGSTRQEVNCGGQECSLVPAVRLSAAGPANFSVMPTGLSAELRDRVVDRLGLAKSPGPDIDGLRAVYAAWCLGVPFDNIAKVIALRTGPDVPLPGIDATEFFERWLTHGAGGTCWSTSNALCEFLLAMGFDARRVAGSMRDTGNIGHGSVKVRIDDADWLVDSSLLTDIPLPLTDEIFIADEGVFRAESEPAYGGHIVWADLPPLPMLMPCRLIVDPTDHAYYAERYEVSRTRSPFNDRLYIRINRDGARIVISGNTRSLKTADGLHSHDLDRAELCAVLIDEFGISKALVDEWCSCGGLEASYALFASDPPPIRLIPPSQRLNRN